MGWDRNGEKREEDCEKEWAGTHKGVTIAGGYRPFMVSGRRLEAPILLQVEDRPYGYG